MAETITIPISKYNQMKEELKTLRSIKIYQRLLEFENSLAKGNKYSRKDLGF